jgi:hypothetical protein
MLRLCWKQVKEDITCVLRDVCDVKGSGLHLNCSELLLAERPESLLLQGVQGRVWKINLRNLETVCVQCGGRGDCPLEETARDERNT